MNRKISAHYIFPVNSPPIKNGVIHLDKNNNIICIEKPFKHEAYGLEFYSGIIVPGFINCHCHIELSYLRNKLNRHKNLSGFIKEIQANKINDNEIINSHINIADKTMYKNGISAIADISNTNMGLNIKKNSNIYYHSFIETYGLKNDNANNIFNNALQILNEYNSNNLKASLSPHAIYSLSENLFNLLSNYFESEKNISSFHFQETGEETELVYNHKGKLLEFLKILDSDSILKNNKGYNIINKLFNQDQKILFIHNTETKKEDLELLQSKYKDFFLVSCPKSNLYINNKVPNYKLLNTISNKICIGTDSLASNNELNILSELFFIQENYPEISFNTLLQWATINGANALNISNKYGSIEPNKNPGLVLIESFDYLNMKLKSDSYPIRLV